MARFQVVFGCRNPAKWGWVVDAELESRCLQVTPAEAVEWWQNGTVPSKVANLPQAIKDKWLAKFEEAKALGPKHPKIAEWKNKLQMHGANTRWGRKTFNTLGIIIVEATAMQVQSLFEREVVQAAAPGVEEITQPVWRIRRSIFTQKQIEDLANPSVSVAPIDKTLLTPSQIVERVP